MPQENRSAFVDGDQGKGITPSPKLPIQSEDDGDGHGHLSDFKAVRRSPTADTKDVLNLHRSKN